MSIICAFLTVLTQPWPRFHVEVWLPFRNCEMDYYVQNITLINSNFHSLDMKSLFTYIMSVADKSIISITSMYLYSTCILRLYIMC